MINFRGMIIGAAVGDAYGSYYEGKNGPLKYEEHDEWILTDDTALILAGCKSIIQNAKILPSKFAEAYVDAFNGGLVRRPGSATLKSLIELSAGIDYRSSGMMGEYSAGNGAAMRICPVAIAKDCLTAAGKKIVREICYITHRNEEAYSASIGLLAAILTPNDPIASAIKHMPDSATKDVLSGLLGSNERIGKVANRIGCGGYSASSVPLAIYASSLGSNLGFDRVIIELCCCGGDADSNSSMAGQIMGSAGLSPSAEWLSKLPDRDMIEGIAGKYSTIIL